jgi:phage shock protein C
MEISSQPKKLYRSNDRILAGVLAGFAEYIQTDATLVRLIFVLLAIFSAGFPGLLVYVVAWIVIPKKPEVI